MKLKQLKFEINPKTCDIELVRHSTQGGILMERTNVTNDVVPLASIWMAMQSPAGSQYSLNLGDQEFVCMCVPKAYLNALVRQKADQLISQEKPSIIVP